METSRPGAQDVDDLRRLVVWVEERRAALLAEGQRTADADVVLETLRRELDTILRILDRWKRP